MNDTNAQQISDKALQVFRPIVSGSNKKVIDIYFQPTDKFADSFVRVIRKGNGLLGLGSPSADTPIHRLNIAMTKKPETTSNEWIGYTVDIKNPESHPSIVLVRTWPQSGGEISTNVSAVGDLLPDILELLSSPISMDTPPRESPTTMY